MSATTHVSAGRRRRQRLRRTLLVTALLVASATTAGYAAWHGDDNDHPSAAPRSSSQGSARSDQPTAGKPSASKGSPKVSSTGSGAGKSAKTSGANGFERVVTDRIPAPTTSLALSAAVPGTTNMQAPAAAAFERALADARAAGLTLEIRSAWRSAQWQQILFDRAVAKYGSRAEASKWVLAPERSAHVKGYAVDVHPQAAAAWLQAHGSAYGICRTYDNEWWHFEYLATSTCPPRQPTAAG